MLFQSTLDIWTVMLYVAVAFILVVLLILPRRIARGRGLSMLRQTEESKLRDSIERLLVELQEVGRELNAKLETKSRVLNRLIDEAEEKRIELSKLVEKAMLLAAPLKEVESPSPPHEVIQQKYSHIYRLADEGKALLDIAEVTGMPPGEVEFVLALRKGARDR